MSDTTTKWQVVLLADADQSTKTIEITGEHGDDVLIRPDGSVTIRRSWRSTGGGHRCLVTYPAWRVTQVTETQP